MDPAGDTIAIRIVIILILLGLSAFFSSSETALTTVNKIRIRTLAESGDKAAIWVMKLSENQSKMLSAILIGNNVVNLSASSMLTMLVTEVFGSAAAGAATGVLTLLILIFGEITPKTIATLEAEKNALRFGHVIYLLMTVLTPVIFLVNRMSLCVLRALKVDPNKPRDDMTEDELRTIVEVGHEKGVIESEEKEMINNVFDLGDSVARDIMVPRIDMTFINIDAGYEELLEIFRQERYTRLPVYQDNTDNVVGIINMKDLLLIGDREHFSIADHLRQPLYTFESKKLSELMLDMRKTSNNIVIVLDEYGATAGLITLEDILEEIVGDIRDEYDEDEEDELVDLGNGEYLVEGSMKLDDLNDKLGLELSSDDYDSIGGFLIERLDHLPAQGEETEAEGIRLVAEQVERNRIDKVHLYLPYKLPHG
ncbi:HlyC/CorC family transporter [Lacrimispora sp. 210928-DFI.3.58]|uniref:HlyC/CorC family transporter n=1 Tax=Lacrimispora sp. 210928-DFI.3.58 TaxID=2883214 RepID=UPI0015B5AF48|nr:hemolysin family protein [Lacrimispora sp. 210928-DFI.3.58]MCB7317841.1 hemolysin family protein [Lacrimispora sp. 210928-DFI.3.58]